MVKFFYTPCGHPFACTGTSADLLAEHVSRANVGFERDLAIAVQDGKFIYRSSCSYGIGAQDALDEISREFPNVTTELIENAKAAHQQFLDWLQAD